MPKAFFETFPTLELDKRVMRQFDTVIVDRVAATKDRSLVRVYITSDHVIPKESVYHVEKNLRKSLYSKGHTGEVKVYETFRLSEAYTAEALFDEYKNSILLELEKYGVAEKLLFEKADITFLSKDEMHLTVEDTGFLEGKQGELKRILEKIFIERCGLPVNVSFSFVRPEKENPGSNGDYDFVVREGYSSEEGEEENGSSAESEDGSGTDAEEASENA